MAGRVGAVCGLAAVVIGGVYVSPLQVLAAPPRTQQIGAVRDEVDNVREYESTRGPKEGADVLSYLRTLVRLS
jgi:hypothetical protein